MMGGGRQTISITQCSHCCSTSSCCPLMCRHHRRIPPKKCSQYHILKFLAHHPCFKGMNKRNVSLFLPVPTTAAYHQLYVQINYVRTVHNWSIRSDHLFKVSQQLCINILTNCLQQRKCNNTREGRKGRISPLSNKVNFETFLRQPTHTHTKVHPF